MSQHYVAAAGQPLGRLDVYVAGASGKPRNLIQRYLKASLVEVNGQIERGSYLVKAGDTVTVNPEEAAVPEVFELSLPVLYQDDDVVIVDKPAGLSVHPGNGRQTEATVASYARTITTDQDGDRPGIVHRLDRDTSGILVIARSTDAKTFMQNEWQTHRVKKTYLLLAVGTVTPDEATINMPLGRDPARPTRRRAMASGRASITRYRVLALVPGYSLIEAYPETGRTHQLRVHFATIGHPIAGDTTYGTARRTLGLKRQFLHASKLTLTVPSGQQVDVESPLPPDLSAIFERLSEDV